MLMLSNANAKQCCYIVTFECSTLTSSISDKPLEIWVNTVPHIKTLITFYLGLQNQGPGSNLIWCHTLLTNSHFTLIRRLPSKYFCPRVYFWRFTDLNYHKIVCLIISRHKYMSEDFQTYNMTIIYVCKSSDMHVK